MSRATPPIADGDARLRGRSVPRKSGPPIEIGARRAHPVWKRSVNSVTLGFRKIMSMIRSPSSVGEYEPLFPEARLVGFTHSAVAIPTQGTDTVAKRPRFSR